MTVSRGRQSIATYRLTGTARITQFRHNDKNVKIPTGRHDYIVSAVDRTRIENRVKSSGSQTAFRFVSTATAMATGQGIMQSRGKRQPGSGRLANRREHQQGEDTQDRARTSDLPGHHPHRGCGKHVEDIQ